MGSVLAGSGSSPDSSTDSPPELPVRSPLAGGTLALVTGNSLGTLSANSLAASVGFYPVCSGDVPSNPISAVEMRWSQELVRPLRGHRSGPQWPGSTPFHL